MPSLRQKRENRRRNLFRLFVVVVAAVLVWILGLFEFVESLPRGIEAPGVRTDAIVVLTGGSGRLEEGLDLLEKGDAAKLFVSGVYRGIDVRKLLGLARRAPEELECCVVPGHGAVNTEGNAAETAVWMEEQKYRSLRLVTSAYHMPRSLLEFRGLMPDAVIIAHPVFPEHVKQDRWWAWPGTSRLIIGEFNKFLLAWARIKAHRLLMGGPRPDKQGS